MSMLLTILAAAGIAAAAWHVVRAALRFLRNGVSGIWSRELAETRARHGDVTGLRDAREERESSARRRRRALAEALGWVALLVVPAFTPWARSVYAAYVVLWVVPFLRSRGRGGGAEGAAS